MKTFIKNLTNNLNNIFKKSGYLTGKRLYLSGPIEHGEDKINWRIEPKNILQNEFGLVLFDPFDDPKQQWVPTLDVARANKDYATIQKIASAFVRKDLGAVDRSDILISCLPYKVPTTGSHHEIINSNDTKKPTLIVCPQGKEFIPIWYYGFIPLEFMFGSWEELYEYLRQVNAGLHKDNDRWAFVYELI